MATAEQVKLAAETYIYRYPLVYDLKEVANGVEGGGSLPMQAPYNRFAYARRLLRPETKFVSPNNDTLYVVAQCDVRLGPLVLHVPDTGDRYYVLQFIDAWIKDRLVWLAGPFHSSAQRRSEGRSEPVRSKSRTRARSTSTSRAPTTRRAVQAVATGR
jgi:hypothetical protein